MHMNFLDFLNKKKTNAILTESFNTKDLDKAHKLMLSIFKKKITSKTVMLFPWHAETLGGREMQSCYFIFNNKCFYGIIYPIYLRTECRDF